MAGQVTAVADMLVVTTVAERAAEAAAVAMAVVPVAARWRWRGWAVAGVGGGEGRQPCDRAAVEMGGGKGGGGDSDGEPTVRAKCRLSHTEANPPSNAPGWGVFCFSAIKAGERRIELPEK